MRFLRFSCVALLLAPFASLGCEEEKDEVTQLFELRDHALCTLKERCCETFIGTVDHCADLSPLFYTTRTRVQRSYDRGTLDIDLDKVRSCYDALERLDCAAWADVLNG